jgi:uncharacterized Zn-binding protein involved in type VI secretion
MSGKPTARITDQTAHDGKLAEGDTTVLVGDKPVSRVTDKHLCKRCGDKGPVVPPSAPTVLVNNRPVARVGDQLTCRCSGEDTVATGDTTVVIGDEGGAEASRVAPEVKQDRVAGRKSKCRTGFSPKQADSTIQNKYGKYLPKGTPKNLAQKSVELVPEGQLKQTYIDTMLVEVEKELQKQTGQSLQDLPKDQRDMIVGAISEKADLVGGFFNTRTKRVYLEQGGYDNAVLHESLHRYAHPSWRNMVDEMNMEVLESTTEAVVNGQVVQIPVESMRFDGLALDEGMTELLTSETFEECVQSTQHPDYTAYQQEVQQLADKVGKDTMKQAYFGGDAKAVDKVKQAWRR